MGISFTKSIKTIQVCPGLYIKSIVFPTSGTGLGRIWANLANPSLRDTWVRFVIGPRVSLEKVATTGTIYTSRRNFYDVILVKNYMYTGDKTYGGHNGSTTVSTSDVSMSAMIFLGKSDSVLIKETLGSFISSESIKKVIPLIQFLSTSP